MSSTVAAHQGIAIAKQIIINVIIDGILFHVFTLNRLHLFCFYIFPHFSTFSPLFAVSVLISVYLFTMLFSFLYECIEFTIR